MRKFLVGFLVSGLCMPLAHSQSLVNAELVNITLAVNRDDNGIKSCGLNFMLGAMSGDAKATIYDFSVNIWNNANGMIKAGSQTMAYTKGKGWDMEKLAPRLPGPSLVWIAKRDDTVSLRPTRYIKGENPGFVLAGTDGPKTLELLMAAVEGSPMQVSIQYAGDRIHRVVGFKANLSQDDQAAMQDCTAALIKRMTSEFDAEK